jgi:hypothetical protein
MLSPSEYIIKGNKDGCAPAFMVLDVPEPKGPLFVFGDIILRKFTFKIDYTQCLIEIRIKLEYQWLKINRL